MKRYNLIIRLNIIVSSEQKIFTQTTVNKVLK